MREIAEKVAVELPVKTLPHGHIVRLQAQARFAISSNSVTSFSANLAQYSGFAARERAGRFRLC